MLRGEVSISEDHGRRRMPQEVAHRGEGNALHDEPRGKGMPKVMEVEISQSCTFTGDVDAERHGREL